MEKCADLRYFRAFERPVVPAFRLGLCWLRIIGMQCRSLSITRSETGIREHEVRKDPWYYDDILVKIKRGGKL